MQPEIGIELSHLSQQLGVLRRAGLVASRKEGQSVYYSVKDPLMSDLLKVAKRAADQLAHRNPRPARRSARGGEPVNADEIHDSELTISDEESRAAMRAFLQRSEVRLSTIHRVAQALLGGSALILLLPLFLRDAFPKMMTVLISAYDAGQNMFAVGGDRARRHTRHPAAGPGDLPARRRPARLLLHQQHLRRPPHRPARPAVG